MKRDRDRERERKKTKGNILIREKKHKPPHISPPKKWQKQHNNPVIVKKTRKTNKKNITPVGSDKLNVAFDDENLKLKIYSKTYN